MLFNNAHSKYVSRVAESSRLIPNELWFLNGCGIMKIVDMTGVVVHEKVLRTVGSTRASIPLMPFFLGVFKE